MHLQIYITFIILTVPTKKNKKQTEKHITTINSHFSVQFFRILFKF